jgi:cytochrome c556
MHDDELEYLLQSESERSSSDSDFDTENDLEDRALLDTVANDNSDDDDDDDDDDSATQDFVWENMVKYKGQRENFTGDVGPQGAGKRYGNCGHFLIVFQQRTD